MSADIGIKQSSRITLGKNGYRVEVVAIVSGVTGTDEERLYNALNDSQLPNYGDAHGTITDIYLNSITADPMDDDKVRVVMSYYNDAGTAGVGQTTVRMAGTTAIDELKVDKDGNAMETSYVHIDNLAVSITYTDHFKAEVERPRWTIYFEKTETSFPKATVNSYLGKINSAIWNGYAVGTILCTAIDVIQQGEDYLVKYAFAHNPDTWAFVAKVSKWPSGLTSSTDPDLDQATGTKSFDVYEEVDFAALGLTF